MQLPEGINVRELEETFGNETIQLNEFEQNKATLGNEVEEQGVNMRELRSRFGNGEEERDLVVV